MIPPSNHYTVESLNNQTCQRQGVTRLSTSHGYISSSQQLKPPPQQQQQFQKQQKFRQKRQFQQQQPQQTSKFKSLISSSSSASSSSSSSSPSSSNKFNSQSDIVCDWLIEAKPGQSINLVLFNFNRKLFDQQNGGYHLLPVSSDSNNSSLLPHHLKTKNCIHIASVKDGAPEIDGTSGAEVMNDVTEHHVISVCHDEARESQVLTSRNHVIKIEFNRNLLQATYLLHYKGGKGWMDGWMDRWMDGWMDGWVDGWMDR